MTEAYNRYMRLERELLDGRASGNWTEADEDQYADEMDVLWFRMTDDERALLRERAAERRKELWT